jgi:hypothetical protein
MSLHQIDLDIRRLESALRKTASDTSQESAFRAVQFERLADLYWAKSQVTHSSEDRRAAKQYGRRSISLGHQAARSTPPGLSQAAQWWALQGSRLTTHHSRFQDPDDLDAAIEAWNEALRTLEEDSLFRGVALMGAANCLSTRFDEGGSASDINQAIRNAKSALATAPEEKVAPIRNDLSAMYLSRFERCGDADDLCRSARHAEASVRRTSSPDPLLATRLLNLANCRCAQYDLDEDVDHLKRAILDLRRAERVSRDEDTDRLPQILSQLARCLWMLHEETQNAGHLELAVRRAEEALDLCRRTGDDDTHGAIVQEFASFLHVRDDLGRSKEEIEALIRSGEIPVKAG